MKNLPHSLRLKLPFVFAGFVSFLFSVWLYFVQHETTAGIFAGIWVPSIHSLGSLLLGPDRPAVPPRPRRSAGMSSLVLYVGIAVTFLTLWGWSWSAATCLAASQPTRRPRSRRAG
jgi:hypothetical protein